MLHTMYVCMLHNVIVLRISYVLDLDLDPELKNVPDHGIKYTINHILELSYIVQIIPYTVFRILELQYTV